jgi:hypothetical protein
MIAKSIFNPPSTMKALLAGLLLVLVSIVAAQLPDSQANLIAQLPSCVVSYISTASFK